MSITEKDMQEIFEEIYMKDKGLSYKKLQMLKIKVAKAEAEYIEAKKNVKFSDDITEPTKEEIEEADYAVLFPGYIIKNYYKYIKSIYSPTLGIRFSNFEYIRILRRTNYSRFMEIVRDENTKIFLIKGDKIPNLEQLREKWEKEYPKILKKAIEFFKIKGSNKTMNEITRARKKYESAQKELEEILNYKRINNSDKTERNKNNIYIDPIPMERVLKRARYTGLHGVKL